MTEKTRIPFDLYLHDSTEKGLRLSRDGNPSHANWIPRQFVTEPKTARLVKPEGYSVELGLYAIEEWKVRQMGWLEVKDENQMGLGL